MQSVTCVTKKKLLFDLAVDPPSDLAAARITMASCWLMYIILLTTYTGNLIAFLSVAKITLPVNNVKELAEQNTHQVGVLKNSGHQFVFQVISFSEISSSKF